eukprot:1664338-Alexandrium_andersonii.AAC.1
MSDVVCVFRSTHTSSSGACFEALRRICRVMHTCPSARGSTPSALRNASSAPSAWNSRATS